MDLSRSLFEGPLQAGVQSICILILMEIFLKESEGRKYFEGLIFGSSFAGMIGSFFYASLARTVKLSVNLMVALPAISSGVCLIAAAFAPEVYSFSLFTMVAFFCLPLRIPILTAIYHSNYPVSKRGKFAGLGLVFYQLSTVAFYYFAGLWLDHYIEFYKVIVVLLALSSFAAAWTAYQLPTEETHIVTKNPFRALSWVYKDRLFGYLLAVWFMFGFANLWIYPIRVTYLHEFWNLRPGLITIIIGIIPEITRLVFIPMWSYFFDRMNFIVMRIILNGFLGAGVATFFFADSIFLLGFGTFLHGIGFAGGRLAWALWVTRLAPKERSSDYMSVHVAMTGVRGFLGPMLGYYVLSQLSPSSENPYQIMVSISLLMIVSSMILLVPVISHGQRRDEINFRKQPA